MCQHAHYVFFIQRYLGRPFQKVCQSNLNPLPTQDLKKGDLLGKGADAVVSIFLLPGNHKVAYNRITLSIKLHSGAENQSCEGVG